MADSLRCPRCTRDAPSLPTDAGGHPLCADCWEFLDDCANAAKLGEVRLSVSSPSGDPQPTGPDRTFNPARYFWCTTHRALTPVTCSGPHCRGQIRVQPALTPCCDSHLDQGCCDVNDCGPCCENCPTCPTIARWTAQGMPPSDRATTTLTPLDRREWMNPDAVVRRGSRVL